MVESNSAGEVRRRMLSFRYAIEGWWYVLSTQRNAWIHAAISLAVFTLAWWLRLSRLDWAVILLTVMVVWTAEFVNTAIEAVVDLTTPNYHPLAKTAKDVAAASVLVAALGAFLIGLLILGPPLWSRLSEMF
jgi:diacylglycerol kinase (ATP)